MLQIARNGVILSYLLMLLSGCARQPVVTEASPCRHPIIDPSTNSGLAQAVVDYAGAIDECNLLNGFLPTPSR